MVLAIAFCDKGNAIHQTKFGFFLAFFSTVSLFIEISSMAEHDPRLISTLFATKALNYRCA